jgi:hypothetical protein
MSLLVLAAAILGGTALLARADREARLGALLCAGAPVGIALLGLVGLVLATPFGLSRGSVALAALLVALPAWKGRAWLSLRRPRSGRWRRAAFWAAWGAVLVAVFRRVFFAHEGGIAIGNDHNLGDLPFHLAIVTGFVEGGAIPPEHPELAGAPLTYPYLVDFVAAMLMKAGASLRAAFLMENLVLALALVGLLFRFALHVTRDRRAAALTPALVLFGGGLGFVEFLRDGPELGRLLSLSRDYTITWDGRLRFGNPVTVLLVPQRTLLLGLPLALLAFQLLWRARVAAGDAARRRGLLIAAGFVAGLLPLAHAHSFAVALGAALLWAILFPPARGWVPFFAAALALGLPQLAAMASGSAVRPGRFLAVQLGWDHGSQHPVPFWLWNAGLYLPLSLLAPFFGREARRRARWAVPFLALFAIPNLLRLSPWIWDNIKFLVYWQVGMAPLVASLVCGLRRLPLGRVWQTALVIVLTASGALDVWRMAAGQIRHRLFDAEAVAAAEGVRRVTPQRAIVLHQPTYDSPVYLAGRRSVLGYPGHIDSQGLDSGTRDEDIGRIYAGEQDAEELLQAYAVGFILVGPQEERGLALGREALARYPLVGTWGPYRLHRVHE